MIPLDAAVAYLDALKSGDAARVASLLAPDGVYHVVGWRAPVVGRDAIHAEMQRQFGIISNFDYAVVNSARAESVVFAEHTDSFAMAGKRIHTRTVSVFILDPDGLIRSVRDFWDTAEVAEQVGGDG